SDLIGYPSIQRCRHCEENGIRRFFDKISQSGSNVAIVGERMPAEHQKVQLDRPLPVEFVRPAQDVRIGIAVDTAVEKLVAGSEAVEQARPAATGAEDHRITPDHD